MSVTWLPAGAAGAPVPLAGLPSPPGKHFQQIQALQPGEWLLLGEPAADPRWGRSRGRTYTCKMAAAPELGGAFHYGEALHGWWDKNSGLYMDDLWFYDLRGHRWICLHPGSNVNTLTMKLNDRGWEVTPDGEPIPVAPMVHGYEMTTYVPAEKRFMFLPCPSGYWRRGLGARRSTWLENIENDPQEPRSDPRFYNVASHRWERVSAPAPGMRVSMCGVLIYLEKHQKTFFYMRRDRAVWLFDHRQLRWSQPNPAGTPPSGKEIEGLSCYDPGRDLIYLCNDGEPTVPIIYDVANNRWVWPKTESEPVSVEQRVMRSAAGSLHYNGAAHRVVFFQHRGNQNGDGVYLYDPQTSTWTNKPSPLPQGFRTVARRAVSSFYDQAWNVHVFYTAGASMDNGVIWVFRCP
jgi:hypothetical protein